MNFQNINFSRRIKKGLELMVSFLLGLLIFSLIEGFEVVEMSYPVIIISAAILFVIGFFLQGKLKII